MEEISMKKIFLCSALIVSMISHGQSYVPEKSNNKIKIKPVIPIKAYSFNLKDVRLLKSPFHHAMALDSAYLLQIKPNRLLYRFYKHAGP
jgi:hypothetical protein